MPALARHAYVGTRAAAAVLVVAICPAERPRRNCKRGGLIRPEACRLCSAAMPYDWLRAQQQRFSW